MNEATFTDLLPMRDVVSLTGVNPVTLRAWERRHGLIRPQRTEGGHRLYTAQDVQHIRDILRWTASGLPISKVSEMLARRRDAYEQTVEPAADGFAAWRAAVLRATQTFDGQALEGIHGQLFTLFPKTTVLLDVLMPVWRTLQSGSSYGQRSQWLFLDAFLRARLLLRLQLNQANAPRVLLAGTGGSAELELLCHGLLLSGEQQRIDVLSSEQPLEELPLLCAAIAPAALVVLVQPPVSSGLADRLRALQMDIACPLALLGDGLAESATALKGIPLRLLEGRGGEAGAMLNALLRGALELSTTQPAEGEQSAEQPL
ncbi:MULTISPECIES: MerR family transcriptional regulator [Pseudomonas]|uniref:MerR family transcriptional regulator n=1 Tax=Pseudomonas putida TaxID=303 RepID=A0A379KNY1_PSEPU|nr:MULTISPECIES: MerR family transcriptional regulator [Pseudomonas]SUD69165.1 MerR family transcriptional regulator [Pseudomonas putida]